MTVTYDAQTPRRSRRYQPLVVSSNLGRGGRRGGVSMRGGAGAGAGSEVKWLGLPLYERETRRVVDLHEEDTFGEDEDEEEEDEDEVKNEDGSEGTGRKRKRGSGKVELETTFYNGFSRKGGSSASFRKRALLDSEDEDEEEEEEEERSSSNNNELNFYIGDTVLVKTQARLPSIGVIIAVWEVHRKVSDEGEDVGGEEKTYKKVRVQWFLRPSELPSVRASRDHFQNEIYFSLASTATLNPQAILKLCKVSSEKSFKKPNDVSLEFTTKAKKKAKQGQGASAAAANALDEYYCGSAIDARRGLYYKLNWEDHRVNALDCDNDMDGKPWIVNVTVEPKGRKRGRKKREVKGEDEDPDDGEEDGDSGDEYAASTDREDEEDEEDLKEDDKVSLPDDERLETIDENDDDENPFLRTPSKKRRVVKSNAKSNAFETPKKRRYTKASTLAAPTPHSRAALRARAKTKRKAFRPAPQIAYDFMNTSVGDLPSDPWLRVMQVFHVGARPDVLPCREAEFMHILRSVEGLLEEGSGGCVYVSGVPGTGKTATVHRIVRELKRMAERNEANPFTYVEINGLKIPEASAAYTLLWEAVSSHDVTADGHLRISSKESLKQLTKYFGAGTQAGPAGHACIVLMDELDQLLTTKQEVVYNFFNWPTLVGSKLIVIAVANTHDLPERVMTGRVRSRLGMTRINYQPYDKAQLGKIVHARLKAAQEDYEGEFPEVITADAINFAAAKVASISGDARRVLDICRRAVELVRTSGKAAKIPDVKEVITRMQSSLTAAYLGDCSLHERIMLASLIKCILRSGVLEVPWDEVQRQHLIYTPVLAGEESIRKPTTGELRMILDGLLASHAVLIEDASVASVARKPEGERKVVLNVEQIEVQRVLSELGGNMWRTAVGL